MRDRGIGGQQAGHFWKSQGLQNYYDYIDGDWAA